LIACFNSNYIFIIRDAERKEGTTSSKKGAEKDEKEKAEGKKDEASSTAVKDKDEKKK
jgi:hypothetical protein